MTVIKVMESVITSFGESIPASRISGSASCLSKQPKAVDGNPTEAQYAPVRTAGFPLRHLAANSIVQ
jgi:hypothetical protein